MTLEPHNPRPRPSARGQQIATQEAHTDAREELIDEIKQALVDEVNLQQMNRWSGDRAEALEAAQHIFRAVDMRQLAIVALDAFQDRVALEIAKGVTKLKEENDPSSVRFGGH